MPTPVPIQFGKTLAEAGSGIVSLENLTNLYVEQSPPGSKGATALYGTPGLSLLATVGDGPVRGMEYMGSDLYVVSGNKLYAVDSTWSATEIGDIDGTGNVHMTNNGTHVAVAVTGGKLYAANRSAGVLELPESNMCGATYQDGYGIFAQLGTEKFWITGLDDMTTIGALDFSTTDAAPDDVIGIVSDHRELWVFGKQSTEVWYNSGDASFPFARAGGGFIEHGCRAPGSVSKAENMVFWLGDDLAVYAAQGYTAQPISTPWVERLVVATTDPGSAWGFTYRQLGHQFYVLNFSDLSICYDLTTGAWHRRKSHGIDRWRVSCYARVSDLHVVGDYANGNIYELDMWTYDENGAVLRREATCPLLHAQGSRALMSEVFIDMEPGVGLPTGQGSDPQIMLDWSDDGGATWSNEVARDIGVIGSRGTRITWNRLGAFRQRTLRFSVSDPVKVVVSGMYARIEAMSS